MRKTTTTFLLSLLLFMNSKAQPITGDHLDINNIKAQFNADGSLFSSFLPAFNKGFEVPKGSGAHTFSAGGLWIGGYDAGNVLRLAGQTYKQTGNDFFPGPLNASAATNTTTINAYNKVWKINKCTIDSFIVHCQTGLPIGYVIPNVITTWPATNPWGQPLAPFVDVDNDGIYSPNSCDYPLIKGDQAVFFVFNDAGGIHTETGGGIIGLEIQAMAYAYNCINDSALYNTIFTHYKIINKSTFQIDSAFVGNWADFDIGSYSDDYVGCDVTRGAMYGYNGDSVDGPVIGNETGYGANPPAQAVVFLRGPFADPDGIDNAVNTTANGFGYGDGITDNERLGMSNFLCYNNDANLINGNPNGVTDFYTYLTSRWKSGQHVTYGGNGISIGTSANYMFPGNSDPLGFGTSMIPQLPWDETSVGNTPSDRRGLGSVGPFTLQPGAVNEIDFAYVYARAASGGNLASVTAMQNRIDSIKQKFDAGIIPCTCSIQTGINTLSINNIFSFYPNPATSELTIKYHGLSKEYTIKIYDTTGKLVKQHSSSTDRSTFSVSELNNGLYLLNIYDGENAVTKRFLKQ